LHFEWHTARSLIGNLSERTEVAGKSKSTTTKLRQGRTFEARYLVKLEELQTFDPSKPVTNKALREALGWTEQSYDRTKALLIKKKRIAPRLGGPGGAVALTSEPVKVDIQPPSVFLSYSRKDKEIRDYLVKHLNTLEKFGKIRIFYDHDIEAGDEWEKKIFSELGKSHIIVLLVSVDFINSRFCFDIEFPKSLELRESNGAIVIPVIARECLWKLTPIGKFQALPKEGGTIAGHHNIDEVLTSIANEIRIRAEGIMAKSITA